MSRVKATAGKNESKKDSEVMRGFWSFFFFFFDWKPQLKNTVSS